MPERDHTWRKLYLAAMLELDPAKLHGRVREAQMAIEESARVADSRIEWQELRSITTHTARNHESTAGATVLRLSSRGSWARLSQRPAPTAAAQVTVASTRDSRSASRLPRMATSPATR
jgi:hypothetical protein